MGSDQSPPTTLARLRSAREKLDAKDLASSLAIYEVVLEVAGDRADVLVTISGDLGSTGHAAQLIELIAPRYAADRHGPATGMNLLQAYLAVRDAGSAQHILDILFSLNRRDLEERLYGFSNVVADLMLAETSGFDQTAPAPAPANSAPPADAAKVALVTISKPVWFYGLEDLSDQVLPPKAERLRRVAFAQLALPGAYRDPAAAMKRPEDELGRLSRGIPAWFAEAFYFSPAYAPVAAIAFVEEPDGPRHSMIFGSEPTMESLRQLVDSTTGGLDYVFTGALRQQAGDYELVLRVWEVKKFRERKQFTARWTPATAEAELTKLREALSLFMEWSPYPAGAGPAYVSPAARPWIDALSASLNLFLVEKSVLPPEQMPPLEPQFEELARLAPNSALASLAWISSALRCRALGMPAPKRPERLFASAAVREAEKLLAR